jgi:hypothetical protein
MATSRLQVFLAERTSPGSCSKSCRCKRARPSCQPARQRTCRTCLAGLGPRLAFMSCAMRPTQRRVQRLTFGWPASQLLCEGSWLDIMMKLPCQVCRLLLAFAVLALAGTVSRGQTIVQSFSGVSLSDEDALGTGGTPPDTMGAAGTNQFVEFINGAFAIYSKTGVRQALITDNTFWENAGISPSTIAAGLTDTRILYDVGSGRWFASEITVDTTGAQVLLARSDTSDPGGTWKAVHFTGSNAADGPDFDTLGVDSTGVYIGVDDYDIFGNFTGVSFFSIPKADLLANPPTLANMTRFDYLDDQVYGFSLQGVTNPDPGPGHGVMIAIDNAGYKFFDRTTINGSGAAGATLGSTVRISNTYDAAPNPAAQPSGQTVDAGDDRFTASVRQVGSNIFMANTILQGSRDAVHWMVLREPSNTLLGEGIISDATHDFFYPSIAASRSGRILLVFNRSGSASPDGNISVYAAVGGFNSSSVTMGSPFLLQQGSIGNYHPSFDSVPYRWGDYSATMVDPTDDNLFWTIQEIPTASTGWGTQITLISLATNRPSLTIARSGSNLNLSWPASTDPAYLLQSAPTVVPSATWTNVPNPATIIINQNVVTVPLAPGPMYYRLKK